MDVGPDTWLEPEQALTRFKRPDISVLGLEDSSDKAVQTRFGFKLENIGILISERTLSEVMKSFQVYPIPNTQPWMQGLTNLRGNLIPVYDLALLLGLTTEPMEHNNLLILEKGEDSIGVLIDNLPRSRDISQWHSLMHSPRLPAGLTDYLIEVYAVDEVIWISFDHKGFFESLKPDIAM